MRTMAKVCVLVVIVLVSVQKVFGNECHQKDSDFTCNVCIRCGGEWCNEPGVSPQCTTNPEDDWCSGKRERFEENEWSLAGENINPKYAERTLYIGKPTRIDIEYTSPKELKVEANKKIHNTTQGPIELEQIKKTCTGSTCTVVIEAKATMEFCSSTGGISEHVNVEIDVGLTEIVQLKFFIPCACHCSLEVQPKAKMCNFKGNYSCGACTCEPGWSGKYCDEPDCDSERGDIAQCSLNPRKDSDCSGNGYCGPCETCICYTDREGSRYFDPENSCTDLCMVTSECEDCLFNHTLGRCENCIYSMTIQSYNKTLTNERDMYDRKMWVACNETIDYCRYDYVAKRDDNGEIFVMMVGSCNDVGGAEGQAGGAKVPLILGVLGIVAAVAAVGGVLLWKHLNTVPPVPLNDPQYQNIDAEDCTGENPLYKPPTSSFKNPTYGKW